MKKLYTITRPKAGAKKIPDRPVRAESGELLTDQKEQRKRWANRFRELLNRPLPSEIPNKEPKNPPKHLGKSMRVDQVGGGQENHQTSEDWNGS